MDLFLNHFFIHTCMSVWVMAHACGSRVPWSWSYRPLWAAWRGCTWSTLLILQPSLQPRMDCIAECRVVYRAWSSARKYNSEELALAQARWWMPMILGCRDRGLTMSLRSAYLSYSDSTTLQTAWPCLQTHTGKKNPIFSFFFNGGLFLCVDILCMYIYVPYMCSTVLQRMLGTLGQS